MKIIRVFVITIFSLASASLFAQSATELLQAMKVSDMVTIEGFLQDKIEFCIYEDQQFLPKQAALKKFKSFLDVHKPSQIEVIHQGVSKDKSSQYKVVKMSTQQGVFRMFIYSEGDIKSRSVREIRIDKF